MIKTILVTATGDATDDANFAAALAVARPFSAHIDVLHVRYDAVNAAVAMSTDIGGGGLTGQLIEQLERDAQGRETRANETFIRLCREAGVASVGDTAPGQNALSAAWHVETGDEARLMAAYGRTADLIVASRPTGGEGTASPTLETVLLEAGRPLLIPPAGAMPAMIERVAIAWKPTVEAARAVALAMPLLARAREITVVTVDERADERDDTDRLVRNLGRHGLAARTERLPAGSGGPAATLLAAVAGRDHLLVMGGYGHSRMREWVFGGFTEQVLSDAPVAVLMAH